MGTIVGNPKKQVTSAAGKGWADLNRIKEFCSPYSGLTARSILKIYKLITLPKILYGVSAWSDCNLDPLITLQRAWLYSATGSFYNPANCDLELLTDITPIKIQVELITAKFLAKLYVKGDNLKHTIFDPNTANPKINNDVTILKRFLAFKNNLRSSHRLELDEIDVQTFQYGKSDINRYEHHLWVNYWLYQDSHLRRIFHIPPPLFTTHSRENEVNAFRLLTGNCPLNGFLYKVWLTESPRCPCGSNVESVHHFILECPRYEEIRSKFNFGNLAESMLNSQLPLFIKQTERFARPKHEP